MHGKMIPGQKQQLRRKMILCAKKQDPSLQKEKERLLLEHLWASPQWQQSSSILLYASLPSEVSLLTLLEKKEERRFFFPCIQGEELHLYEWLPGASWKTGPYGIQEPDIERWPLVSLKEVDLALIPGLAFDPAGGRLGRGRGFYDRLLGSSECRAYKVGVAWSWQMVSALPRESFDVVMDAVVTPEEISTCSKKKITTKNTMR